MILGGLYDYKSEFLVYHFDSLFGQLQRSFGNQEESDRRKSSNYPNKLGYVCGQHISLS